MSVRSGWASSFPKHALQKGVHLVKREVEPDGNRFFGQPTLSSMKHGAHFQHCLCIRLMPRLTQSLSDPLQLYGGPFQV